MIPAKDQWYFFKIGTVLSRLLQRPVSFSDKQFRSAGYFTHDLSFCKFIGRGVSKANSWLLPVTKWNRSVAGACLEKWWDVIRFSINFCLPFSSTQLLRAIGGVRDVYTHTPLPLLIEWVTGVIRRESKRGWKEWESWGEIYYDN